mgnify:CR=1 FL=1
MRPLNRYIQTNFLALGLLMTVGFGSVSAQDTAALEKDLDKTIRAACHSFMVDAIPDMFSWLRNKIYENSSFCKKINSAYDSTDINAAIQGEYRQATAPGGGLDLSKKHDWDLNIVIECDSEYMCLESRRRHFRSSNPITQAQYDKVATYCDGRYGCIQAFFDKWPAPIPDIKTVDQNRVPTFSNLVGDGIAPSEADQSKENEAAADMPATAQLVSQRPTATKPATSAAPTNQTENKAPSSSAKTEASTANTLPALLFGPKRMKFFTAKKYCESRGMHLPTIAEGKARFSDILKTKLDNYFRIWTTDQNASDKYVNRYRTLRIDFDVRKVSGDVNITEGESMHREMGFFCFP